MGQGSGQIYRSSETQLRLNPPEDLGQNDGESPPLIKGYVQRSWFLPNSKRERSIHLPPLVLSVSHQ